MDMRDLMDEERKLLIDTAGRFGTPLYVYEGDRVRRRYRELVEHIAWPRLRIHYAMKANYNPAILGLLEGIGASIDAVSPGDVFLALRCGFSRDRILFTANNITDEEMALVHAEGVLFNIDSLSRLDKYGAAHPGSPVCLRFNPDVVAGAHENIRTGGDQTKFGILLALADEAADVARRHGLKVVGIHKHTGSGIRDIDRYLEAVERLLSVADLARFPDLTMVDFGGGFAVPYAPGEDRVDYAYFGRRMVERFAAFCEHYGREVDMYLEPGKYLVAESGTLLVRVNTVKDNEALRIAGTDSGFPQLIRPMFYGAYHRIENLSNPEGALSNYDVVGNICETGDRFAGRRELPEIREGDLLAIRNAGAYCYSMGGIYNLRPMPAEVLIDGGKARLVRRRLTPAELVEGILAECPEDGGSGSGTEEVEE